ncbi:glycoside hydrolase family 19 protein [Limnohabitans sp.]|jgi:putative chitinase|uniref:glycoside hydrolase family 19 protein n=1 Tax=Limnohabitans sp. TaxID=1907725 RepID=UPI00286EF48E|nr:glycoside hydrolase family 19 protein [Limnohabitans sp.]
MTPNDLSRATGASLARAAAWMPHIVAAMAEFEINTPARTSMFLAQIGHESGGLVYTTELWGPTPAQRGYEGRKDLGNTQPGDGLKYRGRGLIQITGRINYDHVGQAFLLDLLQNPSLLSAPALAARSAAWYWKEHGLNELADAGDFEHITRRINGGLNGYKERMALLDAAKGVFA